MNHRIMTFTIIAVAVALGTSCKGRTTSKPDRGTETTGRTPSAVASVTEPFRDGDLIFQESTSGQSEMVHALTNSRWTHMGVIFNEPSGMVVLEAVSPVRKTPLQRWVNRGRDRHYVVKRIREADVKLPPERIQLMKQIGNFWLGKPYDIRFRWDDESLYCSELVYKLFQRAAGIRLGKLERASDMNLGDERVQQAIRKRFAQVQFDPNETVVSPDSIFNDDQLVQVTP